MKTSATREHPEIEWADLKTELLEKDVDERMEVYIAEGVDVFGNEYVGSAEFFCDELNEVKDIELI